MKPVGFFIGQILCYVDDELADWLINLPDDISLEDLREEVTNKLPKHYPDRDKILDILNEALK